ncbi:MAG: hypothetical protein H6767_07825 [Candidatus Peribacteria bacterium]|nr:MAG: hypothetical protein H6767_07825 [Candidatus Peribacteria bacterium]
MVNHNDATSSKELSALTTKTDNDKNTIFLCKNVEKYREQKQVRVKRVIYLTNTDGLLDEQEQTVKG